MKKIALFFLSLAAIATTGFAERIVLDNETSYPNKSQKSKIAVQWATSAKEVDDGNQALIHGLKLNSDNLQILSRSGKTDLTVPKKAEYFRIVAWSKGEGDPDLHTNWVEIVPNKTYTLQADHFVPSVLILGTGC